jgi:hypothetical protein
MLLRERLGRSVWKCLVGVALLVPIGANAVEYFGCKLKDVTVFNNRIHARCTTATTGGIYFFAVPTSDAAKANRLLTIGTTVLVSGRKFVAIFEPSDTTGTSFGCQADDCRALLGFAIE